MTIIDVQMVERMKLCAKGMNLEDHNPHSHMATRRTIISMNHLLEMTAVRGEERTFLERKEALLVSGKTGITMRRMSMQSMDPSMEASARREMFGDREMTEGHRFDLSELVPHVWPHAAGLVLRAGCN